MPELSSPGLMVDMDLVRGQRWFEQDSGLLKMLLCFSVIQNWRLLMAKARGGTSSERHSMMCYWTFLAL